MGNDQLSKGQQDAVQSWRDAILQHVIEQTEAFYKAFPELRLAWSFTADAHLRDQEKNPARVSYSKRVY